jgi:CoA:oxalate CoA-transferase
MLRDLVTRADVVLQNFRPGVIERQGFGYADVRALNPGVVYGSISGYGEDGPWVDLPGQDLLAQARSGLLWLTGSAGDPPMPMGLAAADMMAGNALAQGVLAALVRKARTGEGGLVQTSLLEALLDFQFEVLTTHLNDGGRLPQRSAVNGAHAYLGAPYGVYRTADGWLALAMTPSLERLATFWACPGWSAGSTTPAGDARPRCDQGDHRGGADGQGHGALAGAAATRRHLVRRGAGLAGADGIRRLPAAEDGAAHQRTDRQP